MNTIIIWDAMEGNLKFIVVDGDHSQLNGVYMNANSDEEDEDRLMELVPEGTEMLDEFPHESYKPGSTAVICCGFIP